MTQVLGQYGVPSDLVYLAFAESSFSKGGAGPWQLTKATARRFGLRVNDFVDERRDPLMSNRAAAEYLAQLHHQMGDWRLTVCAGIRAEHAGGFPSRIVARTSTSSSTICQAAPGPC